MGTYIILLRGINVSGQKKIRMADLRVLLENAGFEEVRTYIQSGNVILQTGLGGEKKVAGKVSEVIAEAYGFEVKSIAIRPETWNYVLHNNPFLSSRSEDSKRLYVTFLFDLPKGELISKLDPAEYPPEEFIIDGKVLYFFSPLGYGRAKMNNNYWEAKLKVDATTRNWRTVEKLAELAAE